jgi:hypothetical protein
MAVEEAESAISSGSRPTFVSKYRPRRMTNSMLWSNASRFTTAPVCRSFSMVLSSLPHHASARFHGFRDQSGSAQQSRVFVINPQTTSSTRRGSKGRCRDSDTRGRTNLVRPTERRKPRGYPSPCRHLQGGGSPRPTIAHIQARSWEQGLATRTLARMAVVVSSPLRGLQPPHACICHLVDHAGVSKGRRARVTARLPGFELGVTARIPRCSR